MRKARSGVVRGVVMLAVVTVAASSCASRNPRVAEPDVPLVGTLWRLETMGADNPVVTPLLSEMRIDSDGRASGTTGCNEFSGTATIDGYGITFSPLVTTRRACEDPVMKQEAAFLKALESARSWSIDGRHLDLFDSRRHSVIRFERSKITR
jgi:heat shock protein HslJ